MRCRLGWLVWVGDVSGWVVDAVGGFCAFVVSLLWGLFVVCGCCLGLFVYVVSGVDCV